MTHINAYFADVDEAKKKLVSAQGELEAAKARLESKKLEDGYEKPSAEPQHNAESSEEKEEVLEPVEDESVESLDNDSKEGSEEVKEPK